MRNIRLNFRINNQIRAPQVRLISADGKQIGIKSTQEALVEARNNNLDLVEIAPNAKPPVAKIVELGKFKYQEEKKLKKQKKGAKASELKEVRFSPFIADHDFAVRIEKIEEFLNDRHKVRVAIVFTGRQMESKNFGYKVIDKILYALNGKMAVDMKPKFIGRHLITVISPIVKKVNAQS